MVPLEEGVVEEECNSGSLDWPRLEHLVRPNIEPLPLRLGTVAKKAWQWHQKDRHQQIVGSFVARRRHRKFHREACEWPTRLAASFVLDHESRGRHRVQPVRLSPWQKSNCGN